MKYHDLSAGMVRMDYPSLLRTAQIAVGQMKQRVSDYLNQIDHSPDVEVKNFLNAEYLMTAAKDLHIAVETLEAIKGMKTREDLKWVNHPMDEWKKGMK